MAKAATMDIDEELFKHFQQKMAPIIVDLQAGGACNSSASGPSTSLPNVKSLDELGLEIVQCCKSLSIYQVQHSC